MEKVNIRVPKKRVKICRIRGETFLQSKKEKMCNFMCRK